MSTNAPRPIPSKEEREAMRRKLARMAFPAPPPKAPIRVIIAKDWGKK